MAWWFRYEAILIGQESGNVSSLDFIRFRNEKKAQKWVLKMNQTLRGNNPLVLYGYREIT